MGQRHRLLLMVTQPHAGKRKDPVVPLTSPASPSPAQNSKHGGAHMSLPLNAGLAAHSPLRSICMCI